jgi:transposase
MSGMGIYSKDIRIRALAAVDRGIPRREEVVQIFSVSLTTLKRWLKMRREGKDLSPGVSTGRRRRILATLEEKRLLWGSSKRTTTPRSGATASCGKRRRASGCRSRP